MALALELLVVAPTVAADWVEVRPTSGTVYTPTVGMGSANVLTPTFRDERVCLLYGNPVLLCLDLVQFAGFGTTTVPFVTTGAEARTVGWYAVHAWAPVTASVDCGASATDPDARYASVALRGDAEGDHTYATLRQATVTVPGNFILNMYVDSACRRVDGAGVPEELLP